VQLCDKKLYRVEREIGMQLWGRYETNVAGLFGGIVVGTPNAYARARA